MMKKYAIVLSFVLISAMFLVGCFKPPQIADMIPGILSGDQDKTTKDPVGTESNKQNQPSRSQEEDYNRYIEAKSRVIERLIDALAQDPDAGLASMSFMGLYMMDMLMWPAGLLWMDDAAARTTFAIFGAQNVDIDRQGDKASVTFKGEDGAHTVFTAEYFKAREGYIFSMNLGGNEELYSEYARTRYGYVAQYFQKTEDDSFTLYTITMDSSGDNGVVGIQEDVRERPKALSGQEPIEFPQTAPQWYRLEGKRLTGVNEEGVVLDSIWEPDKNNS